MATGIKVELLHWNETNHKNKNKNTLHTYLFLLFCLLCHQINKYSITLNEEINTTVNGFISRRKQWIKKITDEQMEWIPYAL